MAVSTNSRNKRSGTDVQLIKTALDLADIETQQHPEQAMYQESIEAYRCHFLHFRYVFQGPHLLAAIRPKAKKQLLRVTPGFSFPPCQQSCRWLFVLDSISRSARNLCHAPSVGVYNNSVAIPLCLRCRGTGCLIARGGSWDSLHCAVLEALVIESA